MLNPNLLVDDHPLTTVEELFATVAGGQRFSKIDVSQAYLQLEVRREDRELLTLSTHRGLFRPTRLMYGVASAPAIFQRLMEQILQDIPGVTIFIDDIRVTQVQLRSKIDAIENMPIPTSKEQIRSFIGLVSNYGRFSPILVQFYTVLIIC